MDLYYRWKYKLLVFIRIVIFKCVWFFVIDIIYIFFFFFGGKCNDFIFINWLGRCL